MKQDMKICNNHKELENALDNLKGRVVQVEVQDYIEKEYEIVLMGCVLRSGGIVIPGTIYKTREWPIQGVTSATIMKSGIDGVDFNTIKNFIEQTGYYGIFSIEYAVKKGKHFSLKQISEVMRITIHPLYLE